MNRLVSILIPAYNAESWIAETIQSALAQTWPEKEIVIVDDGSSDRTLAVARQFEGSKVKVVTQANSGAASARNKALSISQGEYIQWLDADDLLAPEKISVQMTQVEKEGDSGVLYSSEWGRFMYDPSRAEFSRSSLWTDLAPVDWVIRHMQDGVFIQPSAWLVSRELTNRAGLWESRLSNNDDGEYFCRVVLASRRVRFVPGAKCFYRTLAANSLSRVGASPKKVDSLFLSIRLNIDHLLKAENSAITRAACLKYLSDVQVFFYPERGDILQEAQKLASELGGVLPPPRLPFKYAVIQRMLGWSAAKNFQYRYNLFKWALIRGWRQFIYRLRKGFQRAGGATVKCR